MGFFDQMKQLQELKQKMDETKKKLDSTVVTVENEYVRVTASGNRRITNIEVLKTEDISVLEGQLQNAVNEVLEKAESVMQQEMMNNMPKIPGM